MLRQQGESRNEMGKLPGPSTPKLAISNRQRAKNRIPLNALGIVHGRLINEIDASLESAIKAPVSGLPSAPFGNRAVRVLPIQVAHSAA